MREKAKASLDHGQRTSSRWWLVSVHLIWPRLSAIISFHAATLASGTRTASSVSDLWNRWFQSIGQAHRNFDPSLCLHRLPFFLSLNLFTSASVDFTGPPISTERNYGPETIPFAVVHRECTTIWSTDDWCYPTWLSFSSTTLRFCFTTFHRSSIHRFLFHRQSLESDFHRI